MAKVHGAFTNQLNLNLNLNHLPERLFPKDGTTAVDNSVILYTYGRSTISKNKSTGPISALGL